MEGGRCLGSLGIQGPVVSDEDVLKLDRGWLHKIVTVLNAPELHTMNEYHGKFVLCTLPKRKLSILSIPLTVLG